MRTALGVAIDTVIICVFAAIGRRNHGETSALVGVATTAWPFLAGMAAGWLVVLLGFRRAPLRLRDGVPVWVCTVAVGMLLRALTHSGTAPSFVVVAILFLGAGLLGWRAAAALVRSPAPAREHP